MMNGTKPATTTSAKTNGSSINTTTSSSNSTHDVPFIARIWIRLYNMIPFRINLPFTKLDMSFVFVSSMFLATIRLYIAEPILINVFGWPDGGDDDDKLPTMEAAASMTSICHSTLLCTGLIVAFQTQPYRPASSMTSAPEWWREFVDALLQFCTGYMLYDAIINILWLRLPDKVGSVIIDQKQIPLPALNDDDMLFLAHHMMTTLYMTSSRLIQAGHQSAMICMLLGELSNPLHNSYMIGEFALTVDCCNGPTTQFLHYWISVAFAIVYNTLRVVVGPIMCAHVSYTLIATKEGRTNIRPIILNVLWNIMIWGVIFGSSSWIIKCHGIIISALTDYGFHFDNDTTKTEEL
jgi:TLC domain